MLTGARPYDRWSGYNCDFPSSCARASQLVTDSSNDGRLRFVGVNCGINELKKISMRCRTLDRHNPNPLVPDNNLVALVHIEELNCSSGAFFSINCNCAVDHCGAHFDFLAVEAHEGLLIRCHVEIGRKNAVSWSGGDLRVCALYDLGALLAKTQDQGVQRLACLGRHFDSGKALVRSLFADIDFSNPKVATVGQNLIQHLWQDQRIDNVPA